MKSESLAHSPATPSTGSEAISAGGQPTGLTLLDFWRWSASDVLTNTTRGLLAEFLVGSALGCVRELVRTEWDGCLFHHRDKRTANPLDADQWTFYVVATKELDTVVGGQKSIALSVLVDKFRPEAVDYAGLDHAVRAATV